MSESTRVVHILAPAREGGLESVVAMLCERQGRDRVHVVAVLSPDDSENHPFVSKLERASIPVTRVVVRSRQYWREYRLLNEATTRIGPEVIHTHGYRSDIIGVLVARKQRLPVVSTVHGFVGGGIRDVANERVQCLALRRADAVIAVSKPLVDHLLRSGVAREKIDCVPNGFDPPANLRTRAIARRALGLDEHSLVAGWVGRLSREKGADVMLDALARSNDSWRLSVIGDGRERHRLTEQAARLGIADRVTWHGPVAQAGALVTAFDAFVLSSRTEGTPIALFEAMNAKVPVVATRVGGVPDVVTQDQALLVPPDSPATIAAALSEIQREPVAAAQRVSLAYRRLIDDFSGGKWVSAVEEVYRKACASMSPSPS